MIKKPLLIFDFDGTIADTFTPATKLLAKNFKRWGDRFNREITIAQLRQSTITEIVPMIPGGWWKFTWLLWKTKQKIAHQMKYIEAYPGMVYTLRNLKEQGFSLVIVTSNSRAAVINFLRRYNLTDIFLEVYPTKGLFRKTACLTTVIEHYQLQPKDCLYVGDEIRDIQACQKIDLPIISVTYGFNSWEGLKRFKPNYHVKKPVQLLPLIEAISQSLK